MSTITERGNGDGLNFAIVRRPVVVFVDDLDRRECAFVVYPLEIQTLLRKRPLIYVVAADRKWICSSFDNIYSDFDTSIAEPGRPLGYLFLDKVFQLSVSLPRLTSDLQRSFWENVLARTPMQDLKSNEENQKKAKAAAEDRVRNLHTQEQLAAEIAKTGPDLIQQQAIRGTAAKQITGVEAEKVAEHRLRKFAALLEANPRSIKRLVNAYGLHQATHFLEGRVVSAEALARWTIVELRWPILADYLTRKPEHAVGLGQNDNTVQTRIPEHLRDLFVNDEIIAVAKGNPEFGECLDESVIRQIMGTHLDLQQPSRRPPMGTSSSSLHNIDG